MKTSISIFAALALTVSAFADGAIQANSPQAGVLTFNATTGLVITNSYPIPYTAQPIVTVYSSSTNNTPFTVSGVTLTNFILTVSANATTNASVTWSSYVGYPRFQTGFSSLTAGTPYTNAFSTPYAFTPILNIEGSATNSAASVGIISITVTNFIIQSYISQTAYWSLLGTAYSAGVNTVTY